MTALVPSLLMLASLASLAPAAVAQERDWLRASWYLRRQMGTTLVLSGANVVDVRDGSVQRGVDVHVAGDRIAYVGPPQAPDEGFETEVFDVSGRWIVPGFVDLHAHVIPRTSLYPDAPSAEATLEALLDHGVTLARCLPLVSESGLAWAAGVAAGELAGPTLVTASGIFEKQPQRTSRGFEDADTARAWVHKEALLGTRWIKVYNAMDTESLAAIVATAKRYGMRVCGHTEDVPPRAASELGIGTIEHAISIPLSCSSEELGPVERGMALSLAELTAERWAAVDDEAALALVDAFVANGTGWVPTLVVTEAMGERGHDGGPVPDESVRAGLEEAIARAARLAVAMHRRGGLVGTGTDFPVDGVEPGSSLHRELELLVELGGATPLEALRMASWDSVRILGFEAIAGVVAAGRIADFVVLAENPLEDVRNAAAIELVVHAGWWHEP